MTQYTPPVRDNMLQGDVPFTTWDKWFRNVGIRSELALFRSEQSTDQLDIEAGVYCDCFETVNYNIGEFLAVDSNSQVTVKVPGYYNISFSNGIRRLSDGGSSSNPNTIRARLYVNAVNVFSLRGVVYSDAADSNWVNLGGSQIQKVGVDETIRLHCDEATGGETGNDLVQSYISINLVHRIV